MTQLQNLSTVFYSAGVRLVSGDFDPSKRRIRSLQLPQGPVRTTKTPRKVLLIEDNVDGVQTMVTLLHDMGHRVVFALNGKDALHLAQLMRPDFILLDLGLPARSTKLRIPSGIFIYPNGSRPALDAFHRGMGEGPYSAPQDGSRGKRSWPWPCLSRRAMRH